MSNAIIKESTLEAIICMAKSHVNDISSGLNDGMYEASENQDLPKKQDFVEDAARALKNVTKGAVRPMVDVSMVHLTVQDRMILDHAGCSSTRAGGFPRTVIHEYGWLLFLSGDGETQTMEVEEAKARGTSEGFIALMRHAHAVGAYILNFDRDAESLDGVAQAGRGEEYGD